MKIKVKLCQENKEVDEPDINSYHYKLGKYVANDMSNSLPKYLEEPLLNFVALETLTLPMPGDCTPALDFRFGYLEDFFAKNTNPDNEKIERHKAFLDRATNVIVTSLKHRYHSSSEKN